MLQLTKVSLYDCWLTESHNEIDPIVHLLIHSSIVYWIQYLILEGRLFQS